MAAYQLHGISMAQFPTALKVFSVFLRQAVAVPERVCLEAHVQGIADLEVIKELGLAESFSVFAWRGGLKARTFFEPELHLCREARISAGNYEISWADTKNLPVADWSHHESHYVDLQVITCHREDRKANRNPSSALAERLINILGDYGAARPVVRFTTNYHDDYMSHCYWFEIRKDSLWRVAAKLFESLGIVEACGTFAFEGPLEQIAAIYGGSPYRMTGYPHGLWSLSHQTPSTVLAVGRWSFVDPRPNCPLAVVPRCEELVERLGCRLQKIELCAKYLSWRASDGRASRSLQGNYVWLTEEKKAYMVQVGVEQYADEDIPVRTLAAPLKTFAKELGGSFKRLAIG